jgi:Tol biopolymer transport system component
VKGNRRALEAGFFFGNVGESALWVVRSDGGEPIALTDHRSASASPVWLPSDRALLFISTRDGGRDIYRMTLTSSGRPAATPTRLTTGLNLQAMSISRDGRHLTYSVFTESSNIWELPIPDSTPVSISSARPVTSGNQVVEGFDVSADGRWLAFDTDRSGNPDIYRLALPSGEPERLTTDPHEDFGPEWSPDGREITFHAIRGGVRQIFVMDADGRRQVQVTEGTDDERGPVWAADGTAIYFKHRFNQPGQEVRVVARDRAGRWGPARSVLRGDVLQLAVSPGGGHLAFSTSAGLTVSGPAGENPRVLVPVTDPATQVQPNYVSWSADGKAVYYLALDPKQRATVWSVALTGSVRRLLVRFDDPGKEWHRFGFRARGKRFYLILGDRQSDIWTTGLSWVP